MEKDFGYNSSHISRSTVQQEKGSPRNLGRNGSRKEVENEAFFGPGTRTSTL